MLRRVAWIALLPAVAFAAPKGGKKPPKGTTKPPDTTAPADTSKPADTKPADTAKPADAPASTDSSKPAAPTTAPATPASPTGGGGGGAGSGSGAGGGSGSAAETPPPKSDEPDVDTLRQEYLSLRDELFKSRARANAVASQLYSTRVSIKLAWDSGRYYGVSKASIRLDGATVFEDTKGGIAADDGVRFDGYVAPGKHTITFHVDAAGKDDDSFTSATETQVVVKAVAGKDLLVGAHARDGGDIAYEWKKSEHGKYGLGIDVSVKTVAREGAGKK
jgi:hypothetical protein